MTSGRQGEGSGGIFPATVSGRRREVYEAAARIFAARGYRATAIRDIGEEVGLLGGSLYHHIKSKDALFVELHNAALDAAERRIETAVAAVEDPWDRLKAACATLLETQLAPDSLTMPLMNDFREVPPEVRRELVAKRDSFEQVFVRLVDALPLPEGIDRSIYRNLLLNLLNDVGSWFKPGGRIGISDLVEQIIQVFRHVR